MSLSRDFLEEMVILHPKRTGLNYAIWVGRIGAPVTGMQDRLSIRVSNTKGRFNSDDCFVVSVSKCPRVVTPGVVRIPTDDLASVIEWVAINHTLLLVMWRMYETGEDDPVEILIQLQKI